MVSSRGVRSTNPGPGKAKKGGVENILTSWSFPDSGYFCVPQKFRNDTIYVKIISLPHLVPFCFNYYVMKQGKTHQITGTNNSILVGAGGNPPDQRARFHAPLHTHRAETRRKLHTHTHTHTHTHLDYFVGQKCSAQD